MLPQSLWKSSSSERWCSFFWSHFIAKKKGCVHGKACELLNVTFLQHRNWIPFSQVQTLLPSRLYSHLFHYLIFYLHEPLHEIYMSIVVSSWMRWKKKQLWIWGIQGGINCLFEIHTLNDRVKKLAFFMYARMMETALALLETLGQLTLSLGRGASFSASQEEEKPM